ncbi:MAG: hypothetical protein R3288_01640, partial [Woeseiaceae bacterium]|nr:hypothetical protein [Woeseiaceae bacterium]
MKRRHEYRNAIRILLLHACLSIGSLPAFAGETFTDPRDRESYGVVDIAGMRWMTENLRFASPGSVCYEGDAD